MCEGKLIAPPQSHVIKLPELSQEEMRILRQKPAKTLDILMQGLALSLYGEEDGFCKALEALKSCKDISPELARETLNKTIARLSKGNALAWSKLCNAANKRPESPVCRIMLKISPLRRAA